MKCLMSAASIRHIRKASTELSQLSSTIICITWYKKTNNRLLLNWTEDFFGQKKVSYVEKVVDVCMTSVRAGRHWPHESDDLFSGIADLLQVYQIYWPEVHKKGSICTRIPLNILLYRRSDEILAFWRGAFVWKRREFLPLGNYERSYNRNLKLVF